MKYLMLGILAGGVIGYLIPLGWPLNFSAYLLAYILLSIDGILGSVLQPESSEKSHTLMALGMEMLLCTGIVFLADQFNNLLYLGAYLPICIRMFGRIRSWAENLSE
jgi:small basic protein